MLDGAASAQNGLETDCGNEEYTLMSIDTIINGKVNLHIFKNIYGNSDVQLLALPAIHNEHHFGKIFFSPSP